MQENEKAPDGREQEMRIPTKEELEKIIQRNDRRIKALGLLLIVIFIVDAIYLGQFLKNLL